MVLKARQTLVLLQADGSRMPSKTARWFAGRNIGNHFHIRLDGEADFARMARCLAGAATGLVFCGGGARGLAHIDVIRALREAGVAIDMIGGNSMSAVIADTFAMGLEWHRILEHSRDGWLRRKPHKEYTLPLISLVRARVLDSWVHDVHGEATIEDLWLGFYCVSCNLTRSEATVFERGSLAKAIRASASLPDAFVPVLVDGGIHVDGAVVNNPPGDIMRRRSCAAVIVADVGSERPFAPGMTEFPSPWQMPWSRVLAFARPFDAPNIASMLMRTTELGSRQKTSEVRHEVDLCLRPPSTTSACPNLRRSTRSSRRAIDIRRIGSSKFGATHPWQRCSRRHDSALCRGGMRSLKQDRARRFGQRAGSRQADRGPSWRRPVRR